MSKPYALIIEDEPLSADLFSIILQQAGFHTILTHDGQQALNQLNLIAPDLILLDLYLPNVSGKTILEHILADEWLCQTPVFLATADVRLADELSPKAKMSLVKPISLPQLRRSAQQVAANIC